MPSNASALPKSPAKRPNRVDLTDRQAKILDYISEHSAKMGYPPSVRDIGKRFGISSPNGVQCHLKSLIRKGYLKQRLLNGRALGRSIAVAQDDKPTVAEIVNAIVSKFKLTKRSPPKFFGGVDVSEVVEFFLSMVK